MNPIQIEATQETPKVILDADQKIFEITGRSLPEDAGKFYDPIISWLQIYSHTKEEAIQIELKLEYLNTSSNKLLLEVLTTVEKISGSKVIWYYEEEDTTMQDAGEEFSAMVSLPFEFKVYENS